MKLTKDKDLASLCCFMAGVCEENFDKYLYRLHNSDDNMGDYEAKPNPYRVLLKRKGIDNGVYDQLVNECALYLDFVRKYTFRN